MYIFSIQCVIFQSLVSSLKCLQLLFASKNAQVENLGELLGTLKVSV